MDDPNYHYYLVKWIGEPYQAPQTETVVVGNDKFPVVKGDWLCRGLWLEKLPEARNWWTMTDRECVVQLEKVINANVNIRVRSHDNPLRRGLDPKIIEYADDHGAWRISDDDHAFLLEEGRLRDGIEYDQELVQTKYVEIDETPVWDARGDNNDSGEE